MSKNQEMSLRDQILLDKLKSDQQIQVEIGKVMIEYKNIIAGTSMEIIVQTAVVNATLKSIEEQIQKINDKYN